MMARNAKPATATETTGSDEKVVEAAAAVDTTTVSGAKVADATDARPAAAEASASDKTAAEAALVAAVADPGDAERKAIPEGLTEIVAVVAVVSAPGGPRRRAGHAFGTVPVRLPVGDLSSDELEAITADPLLKVSFEGMYEDEAAQAVE